MPDPLLPLRGLADKMRAWAEADHAKGDTDNARQWNDLADEVDAKLDAVEPFMPAVAPSPPEPDLLKPLPELRYVEEHPATEAPRMLTAGDEETPSEAPAGPERAVVQAEIRRGKHAPADDAMANLNKEAADTDDLTMIMARSERLPPEEES